MTVARVTHTGTDDGQGRTHLGLREDCWHPDCETAGFPFPLADPVPDPVMVTRPCGCTSMVTEDGAMPIQVSWCDMHDPGFEAQR